MRKPKIRNQQKFRSLGVCSAECFLKPLTSSTMVENSAGRYAVSLHRATCEVITTELPWWLSGKESTCNAGVGGSVPVLGRTPGGGHSYLLQYSCLETPVDRGAWWATVHRVAKSTTEVTEHAHICITESLCCTPETNTSLVIYTPI